MGDRRDLVVVGGGAAGLATAIFAAAGAPGARIAVLDAARRIGAKILVSGGGRCNVTHETVAPDDFHGNRNFVRNVLAAFGADAARDWFASIGVPLKREETGKLFPVSDRARDVVDALLRECASRGVEVRTSTRVEAIERTGDGFRTAGIESPRVALATGGCSVPKTGSDGSGYGIARALGHEVTPLFPALVPLVLDDRFFHAGLSGISQEVALSVRVGGRIADRSRGSLLWTHFGVSGPAVLDASRTYTGTPGAGVELSLLPDSVFEEVDRRLSGSRRGVAATLAESVPARVAEAIAAHAGVDPEARGLPREVRRAVARALLELPLPVVRDRGWNHAEVTAGGVPLGEVDYRTMESRRRPGLHLVGEILDCDGRIGGFNFQWAWATGFVAGSAIARQLRP